ncbi:phage tail protein [Streptomyces phyllanthi]|uniref:Phage tail protein n=1 Tax=Streptomyces phyllanthi TaxID=1803180 RepID=A0A5N8WF97_9ACTN|nr:phage tail protein [Streptomyces phyllanthi]MPY46163.1 phage tail protein [Streptomyces phyllanthi]
MAGTNSNEIRVAGSGRVLIANLGTAPPKDTTVDWAGWKDLGYTTTDGVKISKKDKLDPIDTWQSVSAARFVYSDRDLSFKFQLLQLNEDTLPFFFGGGSVTETATGSGVYRYDMAAEPKFDERMLGLEFSDGDQVKYRLIVSRGQVTETEEISLVRTAPVKLGVTFTALATNDAAPLATFLMKDPNYSATQVSSATQSSSAA